ncbi:MAG: PorV/PorQ family protein [Elusimicrobiales bacterium]|nr:PorV/PorQ family protein [Elusimicrobiales bacterium]
MKISSIGLGFISAAILCGQASAGETDYAAGTRALPMQQAGGTARATAMGSAAVALDQGSASLLWNPAALSRIKCTELGLHHNSGLAGINQEIGILGMPLGEAKKVCDGKECNGGSLGGIAASFSYLDYGSFDGRDTLGQNIGDYKARDFSGSIGWGKKLLPYFAGGVALKVNQSIFPDKTYFNYAADIGVLWNVMRSLDLGLTYSNISLKSGIGDMVSGLRLGAAWTVDKHLLLTASGELQKSAMDRLQVGGEYLIGNTENKKNITALRAGYQLNYPDPQLSGLTGLTMGIGFQFTQSMALDYAIVPVGDLGASHRLSLTVKFDCPKKRKPVVVMALEVPAEPAPAVPSQTAFVQPAAPAVPPVVLKWVILEDSHFDFDSSVLRRSGMSALRQNIQLLKDNPKAKVRVSGYASASGTEEYNQRLSERRAVAVTTFMIKEGIAPDRIVTVGFGELRPAEFEEDPDLIHTNAAKANRRVELTSPGQRMQ